VTNNIYLLLGGFVGPDGPLTSAGMYQLAGMLEKIPGAVVKTYVWSAFEEAARDIGAQPKDHLITVVGYSGGGSRATWLANLPARPRIDLMVLYDPSPTWQMKSVGENVKRAISYHNTAPYFLGLGGGVLKGPHVTQIDIAENHMVVQADQGLHARTVAEVKKLMGAK